MGDEDQRYDSTGNAHGSATRTRARRTARRSTPASPIFDVIMADGGEPDGISFQTYADHGQIPPHPGNELLGSETIYGSHHSQLEGTFHTVPHPEYYETGEPMPLGSPGNPSSHGGSMAGNEVVSPSPLSEYDNVLETYPVPDPDAFRGLGSTSDYIHPESACLPSLQYGNIRPNLEGQYGSGQDSQRMPITGFEGYQTHNLENRGGPRFQRWSGDDFPGVPPHPGDGRHLGDGNHHQEFHSDVASLRRPDSDLQWSLDGDFDPSGTDCETKVSNTSQRWRYYVRSDTEPEEGSNPYSEPYSSVDSWSVMNPRGNQPPPSMSLGHVCADIPSRPFQPSDPSYSSASDGLSQCTPSSSYNIEGDDLTASTVTVTQIPEPARGNSASGQRASYHDRVPYDELANGLDELKSALGSPMLVGYLNNTHLQQHAHQDPLESRLGLHSIPTTRPRHLPVPESSGHSGGLSSPSLSTVSAASSSTPAVLTCNDCESKFQGEYRRGNLARHRRQKHGQEEQCYSCEAPGCGRDFKRKDARLKHYRKRHEWLAPGPPVARKFT